MKRLEYINSQVVSFFPDAFITSAFRSPRYSLSIGSHPDSFHGYGCAVDYRKGTVKKDSPGGRSLQKKGFYLLEEENCIHVQFTGDL